MNQARLLNLSIGDVIPEHRIVVGGFPEQVNLLGKSVKFGISKAAGAALSEHHHPILAELELYFSCLVRKQVRFREMINIDPAKSGHVRVMPGLYAAFRAVTTKECRVADVSGKPPVETMPVKKPGQFVPDWIRIDYRSGEWLGEYGFATKL